MGDINLNNRASLLNMNRVIAISSCFLKLSSLISKTESMTGRTLVQLLTSSRPMAIILQHATENSPPINRGTRGLEDMKTHHQKQPQREKFKETDLKAL